MLGKQRITYNPSLDREKQAYRGKSDLEGKPFKTKSNFKVISPSQVDAGLLDPLRKNKYNCLRSGLTGACRSIRLRLAPKA